MTDSMLFLPFGLAAFTALLFLVDWVLSLVEEGANASILPFAKRYEAKPYDWKDEKSA